MKVTFCGNGAGASYEQDRGGSCIMLENPQGALLVDCGPGAVRRVALAGVAYGSIGAILVTHIHYDHALGLAELFNRFGRMGTDPPRILGPRGIDEYVENCKRLITVSTASGLLPAHLEALKGEMAPVNKVIEIAGFRVDAIEVPHNANVQAYAWRIVSGDRSVVVSGDLRTDESFMVPFASGADLLVHDAYSASGLAALIANMPTEYARERAATGYAETHSEVSSVSRVARKAGVKRLALTHLVPQEDEPLIIKEASKHFEGEVMIATPGRMIFL